MRRLAALALAACHHVVGATTTARACHEKLIADAYCCLDRERPSGVAVKRQLRPGTTWECTEAFHCADAGNGGAGSRGEDLLWTPEDATCDSPRLLWLHGGSWLYSSPSSAGYDVLSAKLAVAAGAVVLVPDYRLVPLGNYSDIVQGSLDALGWLSRHGPHGEPCPGAQPRLVVGGDSSGGGSALSVVLRLLAEPQVLRPSVMGAVAFSPWTNLICDTPSYREHAFSKIDAPEGPVYTGDIIFRDHPLRLTTDYREMAMAYVANNRSLLMDPVASPYHAIDTHWSGAPPMYFVIAESEVLSGDSFVVAHHAAKAGAEVAVDVFPGMWHVFPMYSEGCGGGRKLWQANLALERTADFVRAVTAGGASSGQVLGRVQPGGLPVIAMHYGDPSGDRPLIAHVPSFSVGDNAWGPGATTLAAAWHAPAAIALLFAFFSFACVVVARQRFYRTDNAGVPPYDFLQATDVS